MNFNEIIDKHIRQYNEVREKYPALNRAATPIQRPAGEIIGRDTSELRLALRNREKANVILLGDPGTGKTAFVQGFTYSEDSTQYLVMAVDIERLVKDTSGDKDAEMANGLMDLVKETKEYSIVHNVIMVLFIDEFHRIAMLSPSSVEALKPILEKSAYNGFRVIAATTFEEYNEWIAPNRALDQRLLRINLPELPRSAVINILQLRAKQYGVLHLADEGIFDEIYDISKQILISNAQPRASLDILLNMIATVTKSEYMENGELKYEYATPKELKINNKYLISRPILNKVIQRSYSIDIDNKVSIKDVTKALRKRVFDQDLAIETILSHLTKALVGLSDPTRPKISFLSTGSTGVGKAIDDRELINVIRNGEKKTIRHGKVIVGDYIFNRFNRPKKVLGVYPQGLKRIYILKTEDGRKIRCCGDHLWAVANKYTMLNFENNDIVDTRILRERLKTEELYIPCDMGQFVKISEIIKTNDESHMTCIMVDDDEHLYKLANGFITHNTELAKAIAEALDIPLKRFDMSSYPRAEDAVLFRNDLARAAWSAPNGYILIDEAEKATREAMNILLQVLDDARLTAGNNSDRVISFTGNIINLTTNIGSDIYRDVKRYSSGDGTVNTELIYKDLSDSKEFETAVLGRLNSIVPFMPLPDRTVEKIAKKTLDYYISLKETDSRRIYVSDDVIPYVVKDRTSKDSERGGARDAKRNIENLVVSVLATKLVEAEEDEHIIIYIEGEPRFKNDNIGDPLNAKVNAHICHSNTVIDGWLKSIEKQSGVSLINDGIFIPKTWTGQDFLRQIVPLLKVGVRSFKTYVDGEQIQIIKGGV